MLRKLIRRFRTDDKPYDLYAGIVAQARQPDFYEYLGVPDTTEGRFDAIVLHMVVVMRRLRSDGKGGRDISQDLFDVFFADMDSSLREMGVSDVAVPRKIRAMGEAFYGRAAAYDAALDSDGDFKLRAALQRNLFGGAGSQDAADAVAAYMRSCTTALERLPSSTILDGRIDWPVPAAIGADET